jgi:hypothetical protein
VGEREKREKEICKVEDAIVWLEVNTGGFIYSKEWYKLDNEKLSFANASDTSRNNDK